jgi:hypothetical protein
MKLLLGVIINLSIAVSNKALTIESNPDVYQNFITNCGNGNLGMVHDIWYIQLDLNSTFEHKFPFDKQTQENLDKTRILDQCYGIALAHNQLSIMKWTFKISPEVVDSYFAMIGFDNLEANETTTEVFKWLLKINSIFLFNTFV